MPLFVAEFDLNFIGIYVNLIRMKQYDLPIIIEQDDDGYLATCPELQGCYSQGETYEEAMSNIKDAINLHLQDRISEKEELPTNKSVSLSTIHVTL